MLIAIAPGVKESFDLSIQVQNYSSWIDLESLGRLDSDGCFPSNYGQNDVIAKMYLHPFVIGAVGSLTIFADGRVECTSEVNITSEPLGIIDPWPPKAS